MAKGKYEYWLSPDGLLLLEAYARDGLTDEQIAKNMGVSTATLYNYKRDHLEILEALKKGKEVVDIEVENALLKRALGYSYTEITKERIVDTGQKQRHGGESELTEKEWEFAVKYFGGKCCYCGADMEKATKDHIRPLNAGGALARDNVIPCCGTCNSSKKDNEMLSWYRTQPFFDEYRLQKINDYLRFVSSLKAEDTGELVVTKEVTKEVLPDTTAQIFWLKNRRPDRWRDKQDIEHSGQIGGVTIVNDIPKPDTG